MYSCRHHLLIEFGVWASAQTTLERTERDGVRIYWGKPSCACEIAFVNRNRSFLGAPEDDVRRARLIVTILYLLFAGLKEFWIRMILANKRADYSAYHVYGEWLRFTGSSQTDSMYVSAKFS